MINSHSVTKRIVYLAVLIALDVVISRFCSINTLTVKIGFSFLVVAVMAMMYGPLYAGMGAATADFIGAILFPTGPYFFGFTLTALISGVVYGLFLHKRKPSVLEIVATVLISYILLSVGLNTYWLSILTGKGIFVLFPSRLIQAAIMIPLQIIGIIAVSKPLDLAYTKQLI